MSSWAGRIVVAIQFAHKPTCAIGVWGNHDLPICRDVKDQHQGKYAKAVAECMKSLEPRQFHKELLFTHVEPWLDPHNEAAMWYCNGPPETNTDLARIFSAVTHRAIFGGHYHAWLAATPESVTNWDESRATVYLTRTSKIQDLVRHLTVHQHIAARGKQCFTADVPL